MGTDQADLPRTLRDVWVELDTEHMKMRLLFNALESAEDRAAALAALGRLQGELENHFAREEGPGGLYEHIGLDTRGAVAVLGDHDGLRRVVKSTAEILEAMERPTAEQIHEATLQLGSELRGHERREHALVQRVLSDAAA